MLPFPDDIIRYIIPFTYNIQPSELLQQIKLGPDYHLYHIFHGYRIKLHNHVLRIIIGMGGVEYAT
jgi:hypothetical protein